MFEKHGEISYLTGEMTEEVLRSKMDDEGVISIVIRFGFDELMELDIEGVNDTAESAIIPASTSACLGDIGYKPVGVLPDGTILVEVSALVDFFDEDEDGEDENEDVAAQ
jgi:hypothetical protein